jgi:hypothetical protein
MTAPAMAEFSRSELRLLRSLRTPVKIQRFIDDLPYHHAKSAWSPRLVMRHRQAHCLEGAVFAAAALRANGFLALLWDLEAKQDDDHVLAIFRVNGHWGAIAKSNFSGLRYREPVHRTLRELAISYFDTYFNLRGDRSLRAYSRPVNLARFDSRRWMTTEESVWFIAEHLVDIPHTAVISPQMARALSRLDRRSKAAGFVGRQEPGS